MSNLDIIRYIIVVVSVIAVFVFGVYAIVETKRIGRSEKEFEKKEKTQERNMNIRQLEKLLGIDYQPLLTETAEEERYNIELAELSYRYKEGVFENLRTDYKRLENGNIVPMFTKTRKVYK